MIKEHQQLLRAISEARRQVVALNKKGCAVDGIHSDLARAEAAVSARLAEYRAADKPAPPAPAG